MRKLGSALLLLGVLGWSAGCGDDDAAAGNAGDGSSTAGKGSSTAGKGSSTAGSGSSTAGNGSSTAGSGSTSTKDLTVEEVAAGACQMMTGGGASDCEGIDEYSQCIQTMCADAYEQCFGAKYLDGDFTGAVCKTYLECVVGADDKCMNDCLPEGDCLACFTDTIGGCALSAGCTLPDCTGAGAGGAGAPPTTDKTCADLEACCNSLDSATKDACLTAYNLIKGAGDAACGAAYGAYMALGCK